MLRVLRLFSIMEKSVGILTYFQIVFKNLNDSMGEEKGAIRIGKEEIQWRLYFG